MTAKNFFKTATVIIFSVAVFFSVSFFYLEYKLTDNQSTAKNQSGVSYYDTPENCAVVFYLPSGTAALINLNFKENNVKVSVTTDVSPETAKGDFIDADYYVTADYELLSGIIDRIGGIEITETGEKIRLNGTMFSEFIKTNTNRPLLRKQIILNIFDKISKNGFSKDDFLYIIESGQTDLKTVDCYSWPDYIKEISKKTEVVL